MSIYGTSGNDSLTGTTGDDSIYTYEGDDLVHALDGNDQVLGGSGSDTLYGGTGNDFLQGDDGNDHLYGEAGADSLLGLSGNDWLQGDDGNDSIWGGDGDDTLHGGLGNDSVQGDNGNNLLYGDEGNDTMFGGSGSDTIYGGTGDDQLQGNGAHDWLYGEDGADSIWGGDGDDHLSGGNDNDYLFGEGGNDTLEGGAGTDSIWGDDGLDVLSYEHSLSSVTVSLYAESVSGADGSDYFQGIEGAIGSPYPDLLIGNASDNLFIGGSGKDRLDGEAGADTLQGCDGDDILMGEYATSGIEAFFHDRIQSAGHEMVSAQIIVPTTPNDPQFLVPVGEYDGVVVVQRSDGVMGTGALLWDGHHILTAAHVVTDAFGNAVAASTISIEFKLLDGGTVTITASAVDVNPQYEHNREDNDIAIIELSQAAPELADRYDIYRGSDEIGKTVTFVGYGATGTGKTGEDLSYPSAVARYGNNTYDMLSGQWNGDDLWGTASGSLLYDFDDGTAANDSLGNNSHVKNLGLGAREINLAHGDSGSPGFIDGKIAGVHSWGTMSTGYGAYGGDTRVSAYAAWIDSIVGSAVPEGGADLLQGGNGNDWLYGGPGSDSLYGDAGDDTLLFDPTDAVVDGGSGNDTLCITDTGNVLFSALSNNVRNIEVIDLEYTGFQFLSSVTVAGVLAVTDERHQLVVLGTGSDGVAFGDTDEWALNTGLVMLSGYDGEFRSYSAANGSATVYVQSAVHGVIGAFSFVEGTSGNDALHGTGKDDLILPHGGNDTIEGGDGNDTMFFAGNYHDYTIIYHPATNNYTITDSVPGRDGADTVSRVEHFQFADQLESVPEALSFSPSNGSDHAPLNGNIAITFSEAIVAGSGVIEMHDNHGIVESFNVASSPNVTINGATLTIHPSLTLEYNTTYSLIFPDGAILDSAGLAFDPSGLSYEFTTRPLSLSGTVSFWNGGESVAGVEMSITSQPGDVRQGKAVTDENGVYSLDVANGQTYTLDARKAADSGAHQAVTFSDALAALKIALGKNPNHDNSEAQSAQYLAADVNHDGNVQPDDAVNILKMAIGLADAPATQWQIFPESIGTGHMSNTDVIWPADQQVQITQDTEINLIGIISGDVNGSWTQA
jgi:Ca2+-binding RTX toxin-like protein